MTAFTLVKPLVTCPFLKSSKDRLSSPSKRLPSVAWLSIGVRARAKPWSRLEAPGLVGRLARASSSR
eukprot:3978634-Alexandrium_andersonii.AAC.1